MKKYQCDARSSKTKKQCCNTFTKPRARVLPYVNRASGETGFAILCHAHAEAFGLVGKPFDLAVTRRA